MSDTKQKWFWYLCLITGKKEHLKWVLSGGCIGKLCWASDNLEFTKCWSSISLSLAVNVRRPIFRSSTEILQVPGPPHCLRISWSTTILRMKISPSSHAQCQESYLLGLILGLIYKLPCKVYFDSCTFSFLVNHVKRFRDYHYASNKLFCCSCCAITHILFEPLKLKHNSDIFTLLEQQQITLVSSLLMITHISKSTLSVASYRLCWADAPDVHPLWRILGAEIYDSSKNIWPYKYTIHLWEA